MTTMMDRGDSYKVGYLGSSMLMQMSTGLGALQKPLRDLYIKFQKNGKNGKVAERQLVMTGRGMSLLYKETGATGTREEFYDMASIMYWAAVRFITVRGPDKKIRWAFEPLNDTQTRTKFSVLDKKYHFLQPLNHPPIFVCVMRRTHGLKALDVHAFMCYSDDEAIGLTSAVNLVQDNYRTDELQETGVFGYNPFGRESVRLPAGHDSSRVQAGQLKRNVAVESSVVSEPARTSDRQSEGHKSGQRPETDQGRFYQLTQMYFQPAPTAVTDDSLVTSPTYQDLHHTTPVTTVQGGHSSNTSPSNSPPLLNSPNAAPNKSFVSSLERIESQRLAENRGQYSSFPRKQEQVSSSYYGNEDVYNNLGGQCGQVRRTVSERSPSKSSNTGKGYSLLSGSHGPLPGHHPPRDKQPLTPEHRRRRPESPHHEGILSPSYEQSGRYSPDTPARGVLSPGRVSSPPRSFSPVQHGLPRTELGSPSSLENHYWNRSHTDQHGGNTPNTDLSRSGQFSRAGGPSEAPHRPVAKVSPHKIQGVRVLPTVAVTPRKASLDGVNESTPRPKSSYGYSGEELVTDSVPRRSHSQYFPAHPTSPTPGNWQFGAQKTEHTYQALKTDDAHASGGTGNMNEKLLLTKKKDAEIASVMQNLRFDGERRNVVQSHTNMTNFEKSLGYFP